MSFFGADPTAESALPAGSRWRRRPAASAPFLSRSRRFPPSSPPTIFMRAAVNEPMPFFLTSGVTVRSSTIFKFLDRDLVVQRLGILLDDLRGLFRVLEGVLVAAQRRPDEALYDIRVLLQIRLLRADAVRIEIETVIGEQEGDDLRVLHRAFHRRLRDDEEVDRRYLARREHRDARRRLDAFHLQLVRIEAFLAHHRLGDVRDVAAGIGADRRPSNSLSFVTLAPGSSEKKQNGAF